ncbi:MAG: tRNA (adenosine(37)-N6)-threonylcarbamoyltransferase complex ATPase subunit type 1 TsaE [Pseudohongiellaceae bacterium]
MLTRQLFLPDEAATLDFGRGLARATFPDASDEASRADAAATSSIATSSIATPGHATVGGVIHLTGDLGAGKTTLTRGILRGFGYEGAVKSPTYTIVEPYEFDACHIYHFDLYRLASAEEVEYLGAEDYFRPPNLCIVEWAERGEGAIPPADLAFELVEQAGGRLLTCRALSKKGRVIVQRMWPEGRNL